MFKNWLHLSKLNKAGKNIVLQMSSIHISEGSEIHIVMVFSVASAVLGDSWVALLKRKVFMRFTTEKMLVTLYGSYEKSCELALFRPNCSIDSTDGKTAGEYGLKLDSDTEVTREDGNSSDSSVNSRLHCGFYVTDVRIGGSTDPSRAGSIINY